MVRKHGEILAIEVGNGTGREQATLDMFNVRVDWLMRVLRN